MKNAPVITAIDIGTTKICAIIAELTDDNKLEVKGIGESKSRGLEKGIVKDIGRASESIKRALEMAEKMADLDAVNLFAGIAGEHIKSRNSIGRISISDNTGSEPSEIDQSHIESVINDAKRGVKIQQGNENLEIIHGIPQYFDIDAQKGVMNPMNMSGFHLTAHVHVVLADMSAIRNILRCVEIAGYDEPEIVLEPIASAKAVLNEDEINLGCIFLDIGGGTTDIAVFYKGSIRFSTVKPLGGMNITNDLSIGLRTPPNSAEKIKISKGSVIYKDIEESETVQVEGIGGRSSNVKKLRFISEIIESRMREILDISYETVFTNYNQDMMTAGLILTGGSSLLTNTEILATEIYNMPVKIGLPNLARLSGPTSRLSSPIYSTSVGLLYYALDVLPNKNFLSTSKRNTNKDSINEKIINTLKHWFHTLSEFF